ncbi:hypothetical protein Trco_002538 [Trichoderma cornu-damae]|uniref:Protein phosphatase 4 core regulatory subunit R2 n=1 Tax=Trichoderma cornu-damae TaxID=654480 RepID=A0A9P8QV67_9HYPO|nr:hypothetical protein Trco_002538 [Trichoderma cornu-damae]
MEVDSDSDNGLLGRAAAGEPVASCAWPALRDDILVRLDKTLDIRQIARNQFAMPKLPPPVPRPRSLDARLLSAPSPSPAERSSEDANKENAPLREQPPPSAADSEPAAASQRQPSSRPSSQAREPGALPKQLADMVEEIKSHIGGFKSYPPHTIQRIAELVLYPRAHYKALASYLHALDRVAAVTSGTDTYPLPPPIPDMSSIQINGDEPNDPAMAVSWSNPAAVAVGSDEALGGALLTPIPWLTRRSPPLESVGEAPAGAQIHSESTETIEGPNGVGSIETVSVSINGVPSVGHSKGVTQGELLRQEQRAGIVPVSQLAKSHDTMAEGGREGPAASDDHPMDDEEEGPPHARGPEEIGIDDTGPQSATTSLVGEDGVEMQGIDLEAAVGRKLAGGKDGSLESSTAGDKAPTGETSERAKSPGAESASSKREAEDDLDGDVAAKKIKEGANGDGDASMSSCEETPNPEEQNGDDGKGDETSKDSTADKDAETMEA